MKQNQRTKTTFYIKSLDSDHTTKTLVGEKRQVCQTIEQIVKTAILKPNTKSFGQKKRLSTTILHKNYLKSYRPQGIIFTTNQKPEYILPFDLMLATQSEHIVVHYYRMRDNLHTFYNHPLIPGYEQFVFKNMPDLVKKFTTPEKAWQAINVFRFKNGQRKLPRSKARLCSYNEAVFMKPIQIKIAGIFGYRKGTATIAHELNVPYFTSAKAFYKKQNRV